MKRCFTLASKPHSINSSYTGNGRFKTSAFRQWTDSFLSCLHSPDVVEALKDLREEFNPKTHHYVLHLTFLYPRSVLYTKSGELSSKAFDLSNVEKCVQDCLFLPKFYGETIYEAQNLNIDDRYVKCLISEKDESDDGLYYIKVQLMIKKNPS